MSASLGKITRTNGVAGQIAYGVNVSRFDAHPYHVSFVGSAFGGPVVMVTEAWGQIFVTDPERFGTFGPEWVRRFFASSVTS